MLVLSTFKKNTLQDCIITIPEMIAASFSKQILIKSFVSAGIIDDKTKTYVYMYAIMNSFKIYWNKVDGGRRWFIDVLPSVLSEMFMYGEVSEIHGS